MKNRPQNALDRAVMATCDGIAAGSTALRRFRTAMTLRREARELERRAAQIEQRADTLDGAGCADVTAALEHGRSVNRILDPLARQENAA